MSTSLQGKLALITGSSRGIGWQIARTFADSGASVILHGSRHTDALDAKRESLGAGCVGCVVGDVASATETAEIYKHVFSKFKRLDILVNNAGILDDHLLAMISTESVERTLDVNALGSFFHLQRASRLMGRAKSGSIINLTSIIGTNGNEGQVAYGMSKAAVIGMTKSAAKELAPSNIRVNAIAPGFIDTDMTRSLPADKYSERLDSVKIGRVGTPEDVAGVALFLASDLSAYVTGQVIGVDGGMLI